MQKYLDMLLNKYSVGKTAEIIDGRFVKTDGKTLPLLPWRNERRVLELKKLVENGEINGVSVMRTLRMVRQGADLADELYREFDLSQYILGSKIREIFAVGDMKHAVNIIAKTADGYVASFEISASLPADADVVDKHEIIAQSGVACDRAADTQIPQSSIYVFGKKEEAYTDVDAELFGLTAAQCAIVRAAFETAKSGADLTSETQALKKLVSAVEKSLETTENIPVGE